MNSRYRRLSLFKYMYLIRYISNIEYRILSEIKNSIL